MRTNGKGDFEFIGEQQKWVEGRGQNKKSGFRKFTFVSEYEK